MITAHPTRSSSLRSMQQEEVQTSPKVQSVSGHAEMAGRVSDSSQTASSRSKKSATAFRTISEVAKALDVQQHVLRFWETKFSQVRPMKRGGGRRYYRPEDVALLKHIHHLLYTEGYTIKGVQKLLKGQGKQQIVAASESKTQASPPKLVSSQQTGGSSAAPSSGQRAVLETMLAELKALRDMLD